MNRDNASRLRLQQPQRNLRVPELQEASPQTHIEIEEGVHLVLNNGDRLEQLLCIHGPHYAVHSVQTRGGSEQVRGERERWMSKAVELRKLITDSLLFFY